MSISPENQANVTNMGAAEGGNQRIVDAMNKWSGAFFKPMLPSQLGTKANIKTITDEGAKVLSMGFYMGRRTAEVDAIPYDGSRYEGHTMQDESEGTLWAYETIFPDSFNPTPGGGFLVSLGHTFKCPNCRGQGLVTCRTCNGRVRWTTRSGDRITEHSCNCGTGKQNCGQCDGYGEMLKVLNVSTQFVFDERKEKEYSGKLPIELLMKSPGSNVFRHVAEFEKQVIAEAIDGFQPEEFDRRGFGNERGDDQPVRGGGWGEQRPTRRVAQVGGGLKLVAGRIQRPRNEDIGSGGCDGERRRRGGDDFGDLRGPDADAGVIHGGRIGLDGPEPRRIRRVNGQGAVIAPAAGHHRIA